MQTFKETVQNLFHQYRLCRNILSSIVFFNITYERSSDQSHVLILKDYIIIIYIYNKNLYIKYT
jgi:hypothetical protein